MTTGYFRAARSAAVALALVLSTGRSLVAQAATAPASAPADDATRAALSRALNAVRGRGGPSELPAADRFTFGDRTVLAGAEPGPVAVANGTLHVRGTVDGDAIVWRGNIVIHQGGRVSGNAWAIGGKVLLDGGTVDGDVRAFDGDLSTAAADAPPLTGAAAVWHAGSLAFGWLVVVLTIGIGVLVFAGSNLQAVSDGISRSFGRAFVAGVAAQLALLPVLVLLAVALCLTVLGILLIPFAIVAYVLAAAGLVTLGYLAMASILGQAITTRPGRDAHAERAAALRSLVIGVGVLMAPWFAAGAMAWSPTGALVARVFAVAVTWVAATAGLGGAVLSRGGVRRAKREPVAAMSASGWATPTPISGVVAARRPTNVSATGTR